MNRRGFFGRLCAALAASFVAWTPSNVFASGWRKTDRYHPDLIEWGFGFCCTPEVLEDAAAYHRGCETMRLGMLEAMRRKGPINLWRAGNTHAVYDESTGEWVTTLRQRACNTSQLDWKMPPDGITVRHAFTYSGGPDAFPAGIPFDPKPEGADYTFFQPE